MNTILKSAAVAAFVGAVALASATPGEARDGRWAAAGAGFAVGTVVGAVAANANGYYGRSYYGRSYYAPGYAYGMPSYDAYAYDGPTYAAPRYYRAGDMSGCGSQGNYGQSVDRSACNQ